MGFFQKLKLKNLLRKANKYHQQREQGGKIDVKDEVKVLHELGKFYDKHLYDKKYPNAGVLALEYYRAAALLDDREAQYICGQRMMDKAHFWNEWATGIFATDAHQHYRDDCYAEALKFYTHAEEAGHILAKRMRGLAYIRGWGVPADTDTGFKLVVASIDQEGAWEKATKIFTDLGLNSPEFFTALMSHKAANNK